MIGCVAGVPCLTRRTCRVTGIEIDLIPTQIDQLADAQAVTIGHQDHGAVALAVAVVPGSIDQLRRLSASVRCSRVRSSALGLRRFMSTVCFSMVGMGLASGNFIMIINPGVLHLFVEYTFYEQLQLT